MAGWRLASLPKGLADEQVQALLGASDNVATPAGCRDHAVLVTLAQLGLRGGGRRTPTAGCRLAWRTGRGKRQGRTSRTDRSAAAGAEAELSLVSLNDLLYSHNKQL